ncbi:MAG: endonuclease III [Candidatus Kaiserbacteria bacterium]|nr:endonuclease III [Candidatus Kaiserbacteria bacterium]
MSPSSAKSYGGHGAERKERAEKIVAYLKKAYPKPKSELSYTTPFQFVAAVILSAQCTDKKVNECTAILFKKYKTVKDFANADRVTFTKEISSIPFFRNKAKNSIAAAKEIQSRHGGAVPRTEFELVALPGIGYKTAHVVLGELYDIWEGIATDTHVKRFAKRFDLTDSDDPTKISKDLEALIPKKDWKYVNNGLVLYGRYVCPARPHDCTNHPLTKLWPPAATRWPKTK